jgi:hypothetical protein
MALTFEDACEHPELRQEFLNHVDLEWARPYIRAVYSVPDKPLREDMRVVLMHVRYSLQSTLLHRKHARSSVYVHQASFNPEIHPTVDDFLSTLIDHEGTHARDAYFHPGILQPNRTQTKHAEDAILELLRWMDQSFAPQELSNMGHERMKYLLEIHAYGFQLKSGRSLSPQNREHTEAALRYARCQYNNVRRCIKSIREESESRMDILLTRLLGSLEEMVS